MSEIIPGYKGKLSQGGTSTALTAEACSLVTGKTYQIANAAKRRLDPGVAIVVYDNGVQVAAANILKVDANIGEVTFVAGYTPTTPITIHSGNYIPQSVLAGVKSAKGAVKLGLDDVTQINQTVGYVMRLPMLNDFDCQFDLFDFSSDQGLGAAILNKTLLFLELDEDGTGVSVYRAWGYLTQQQNTTDPTKAIVENVSFQLADQSEAASALSGFQVNAGVTNSAA